MVGSRPELPADRLEICRPELVAHGLLALVLDRALVVDQPLLGLAHELLQHLLELGIGPAARSRRCRVLQRLDREIDLAVLLDGDDFRLDDIPLAEVIVDVLHVVPIDLGDVNQPETSVFELEERPVGGDAGDGAVDHRADFDLCDESCPFFPARREARLIAMRGFRATGASVREAVRGVNGGPGRTRRSCPLASRLSPGALSVGDVSALPSRDARTTFRRPLAFQEAATPYLVREEARHNLLLGVSTTLIQRPDLYEAFDLWVVSEETM